MCASEVMLKAIGVAFRSVMFALLLLLGVVYVFAIVALHAPVGFFGGGYFHWKVCPRGSLQPEAEAAAKEGVSIGYLWAVESVQPLELQLKRPMPAQFFTQLLDGKAKQSGDIAYDNFRTVAALWRRTTSFAVS